MQVKTANNSANTSSDWKLNRPVTQKTLHQHLEDAAFCWWRFHKSQWSPLYNRQSLDERIERLEANLEGLRVAGKSTIEPAFERFNRYKTAGDTFVCTYLLVANGAINDSTAHSATLEQLIVKNPHLAHGASDALLWAIKNHATASFGTNYLDDLHQLMKKWFESQALFQRIALPSLITAYATNTVQILSAMLTSPNLELRTQALLLIGDTQALELQEYCLNELESHELTCRAAAGYALALFGNRCGIAQMRDAAPLTRGAEQMRYLLLWSSLSSANDFTQWLSAGPSTPEQLRLKIRSVALRGDPSLLPFLASCLTLPMMARLAAYAISHITGADIDEINDLNLSTNDIYIEQTSNKENIDETDKQYPEDVGLPYPDIAKLKAWIKNYSSTHNCLLSGKPLTIDTAESLFTHGNQPQRWQSALYLGNSGNWTHWKNLVGL